MNRLLFETYIIQDDTLRFMSSEMIDDCILDILSKIHKRLRFKFNSYRVIQYRAVPEN